MKILITGIAGFVGSHLADALSHHQVVGIDDLSTGQEGNVSIPFTLGDIRDGVPRGDWDVIYHCAASYKDRGEWERDASTNTLGTIDVVREAQRSGAKLVYFQTSLCYGPTSGLVQVGTPLDPRGSYAVSKTAGESYIRDSGVPYVSLRLANVYGPRNLSGPVPVFYQRLSEGKPCTVVDSRRDFIFIDDLIRLAVAAGTSGAGVYHASSGSDLSIATMYDAIARAMQIDAPPPTVTPRGADDVATLLLDPSETYLEYGWAAHTPLPDGIAKAVSWYRDNGVADTFTHLKAAQ